jgi:hypothetical protein
VEKAKPATAGETKQPTIVYALIERFIGTCREAGATLEESVAALEAAIVILPHTDVQSSRNVTVRL